MIFVIYVYRAKNNVKLTFITIDCPINSLNNLFLFIPIK